MSLGWFNSRQAAEVGAVAVPALAISAGEARIGDADVESTVDQPGLAADGNCRGRRRFGARKAGHRHRHRAESDGQHRAENRSKANQFRDHENPL